MQFPYKFCVKALLIVGLITIILNVFNNHSNKISQNQDVNEVFLFRKHRLEQQQKLFYTTYNQECMQSCIDVGGVNCGKHFLNCCQKDSCDEKQLLGLKYGNYCQKYIAIIGCTTPS